MQPNSKTHYTKRDFKTSNSRNLLNNSASNDSSSSTFLSKRLSNTLSNFKFKTPSNKSTSISGEQKTLNYGNSK